MANIEPIHAEYARIPRAAPESFADNGNEGPTPSDIEGPFWLPGSPLRTDLCPNPKLFIQGRVLNCKTLLPVNGVTLDFWQARPDGTYDEHGMEFRGHQKTAPRKTGGNYLLETVKPGDYKISEDEFRCAHIHVKVSATGYKPITTQLYFRESPHNETDRWFDERRVIVGPRFDGGPHEFDFYIEPEE